MRALGASIIAFILSGLVGGIAAVQIAVMSRAQEEFIVVFFAVMVGALLTTVVFLIAQLFGDPFQNIDRAGWGLSILFALCLAALLIWSISSANNSREAARDMPLIAGIIAPAFLIVATQWLFLRWRLRSRVSE